MFINLKINGRNIKFEIDPLESILSIKSKICHDLLNGRDPDSIQLYFNQKLLKNEDYGDKMGWKENDHLLVHNKRKGGGLWKKIIYYIIVFLIFLIPIFVLPMALDALSSNFLTEIMISVSKQMQSYLVCELKLTTLPGRIRWVINLIKYFFFIMFTYVVITVPIVMICLAVKGKTLESPPLSLCSPLGVGTTTGLIFTVIYFIFYFSFRFSDASLIPLMEYSKTNFLTNVLVRPILSLFYKIFNFIKFTGVYLIPFGIGVSAFKYHRILDNFLPVLFGILTSISQVGCQENINMSKLKNLFKNSLSKLTNKNKNKNENSNNNENNNNHNNETNEPQNIKMNVNKDILNIQFKNNMIDNFGINQQLSALRNELKYENPICKKKEGTCCNIKMIGVIADSLYQTIENPIIKTSLILSDVYLTAILVTEGLYKTMMFYAPVNLEIGDGSLTQKKINLKKIVMEDNMFLNESLTNKINMILSDHNSTNEDVNNIYNNIVNYLHKDNITNADKLKEIEGKITQIEAEAYSYSNLIGGKFTLGESRTKEYLVMFLVQSICNIFESSNSGAQLINQLGGVNIFIDIMKSSSAAGTIIVFFYIITVIVLVICGIIGVY